jgi:hypothetical protein
MTNLENHNLKKYLFNLFANLELNELAEELKFAVSRSNELEAKVLRTIITNKLYIKNNK